MSTVNPLDALAGWKPELASSDDPDRATAFVFVDGEGHARLLDLSRGLLHPVRPRNRVIDTGQWHYLARPAVDVDRLRNVVVCDDEDALRAAIGPPKASSLGRPAVAVGGWNAEENIVLERTADAFENKPNPRLADLRLLIRSQRSEPLHLACYVDEHTDVAWFSNWLSEPKPGRLQKLIRRNPTPSVGTISIAHRGIDISIWSNAVKDLGLDVEIKAFGSDTRADRYWHTSAFADIVLLLVSDHEHLPADRWAGRTSAIVMWPRAAGATESIDRIAHHPRSAVFFAEKTADRIWQAFTSTPRISELIECLRRLLGELRRTVKDKDRECTEVGKFVEPAWHTLLNEQHRIELKKAVSDDPTFGHGCSCPVAERLDDLPAG